MEEVRINQGNGKRHKGRNKSKNKAPPNCSGPTNCNITGSDIPGPSWFDPLDATSSLNKSNSKYKIDETDCDITSRLESLSLDNGTDALVNGTSEPVKNEVVKNSVENSSNEIEESDVIEKDAIDPAPSDVIINYVQYESELQMPSIMKIIQKDLSEPYSIYTYRYFIHNWPKLCFLAMCEDQCVGAIVCKLDVHHKTIKRGYIAMLAVDQNYRKRSIGSTLVKLVIRKMIADGADEVVLETEVTNKPALQLYEALGFVRDKRLFRYYLNGVDALRLKLWLR